MNSFFDLTDHTRISIRSTTGRDNPEDLFFGVYVHSGDFKREPKEFIPVFSAYDTFEWERAVQMAKWILEWDERIKEAKK